MEEFVQSQLMPFSYMFKMFFKVPGLIHSPNLTSYNLSFLGGSSPVVAVMCNNERLILGIEKRLHIMPVWLCLQHTVLLRLFTAYTFCMWFRKHHNKSHVELGTCRRGIWMCRQPAYAIIEKLRESSARQHEEWDLYCRDVDSIRQHKMGECSLDSFPKLTYDKL